MSEADYQKLNWKNYINYNQYNKGFKKNLKHNQVLIKADFKWETSGSDMKKN